MVFSILINRGNSFANCLIHGGFAMLKIKIGLFCTVLYLLISGSITFAAPSVSKSADNTDIHTFAVIPFYTPEKIWTLYTPFIEYLKKSTGVAWQLKLYNTHDELIEDICRGRVSAALLGPVPLGRANEKCGVKPLLAAIGKDGKPSYHSVILTNTPTFISLRDLNGGKFGFYKGSTAAHIIPAKMLKDAGVAMTEIQPVFFEGQDKIMSALISGEITAAGVKENLAKKFDNVGLKTLAISQPLPNFAICANPSLSSSVRRNLVSSLTLLKPLSNSADANTMKSWDDEIKNGFTTPDKDFLPSVKSVFKIFVEIHETTK